MLMEKGVLLVSDEKETSHAHMVQAALTNRV